jgi:hypothetical protein
MFYQVLACRRLRMNRTMNSHWNRALVALAFAVVAPLSVAQTITVNPGSVVQGGASVNVSYADASRAGQTITIMVGNGEASPLHQEVSITVKLDGNGKGEASWVAESDWDQAIFSCGNAPRVTIIIT